MCVLIYILIYKHMYVYIYTHTYTCTHTYIYIYFFKNDQAYYGKTACPEQSALVQHSKGPSNWVLVLSLCDLDAAFPISSVEKNLPDKQETGDGSSIPGLGRSPGAGNGNPLRYSCLEKSMDRGAWQATVQGITTSWTQLRILACGLDK